MAKCYYCPRWHTSTATERECAMNKLRPILHHFEAELRSVQVLLALKKNQCNELQKRIKELKGQVTI